MKKLTQAETKRLKKSFWKGFFFMFDLSWLIKVNPPEPPPASDRYSRKLESYFRKVGDYMRKVSGE